MKPDIKPIGESNFLTRVLMFGGLYLHLVEMSWNRRTCPLSARAEHKVSCNPAPSEKGKINGNGFCC